MKKNKFLLLIISLSLVLSLALIFSGCSENTTFKDFIKFKQTDVEKIELISEYNVVKSAAVADVFTAFTDVRFIKTKEEKFESDWDVNRKMTVNFYLKGKTGYYSIVLNNGARAMEGFSVKCTTGFYSVDNADALISKLNIIFYSK